MSIWSVIIQNLQGRSEMKLCKGCGTSIRPPCSDPSDSVPPCSLSLVFPSPRYPVNLIESISRIKHTEHCGLPLTEVLFIDESLIYRVLKEFTCQGTSAIASLHGILMRPEFKAEPLNATNKDSATASELLGLAPALQSHVTMCYVRLEANVFGHHASPQKNSSKTGACI